MHDLSTLLIISDGPRYKPMSQPQKIRLGAARETAKGLPAILNVSEALSLAGPGPDKTVVDIWRTAALVTIPIRSKSSLTRQISRCRPAIFGAVIRKPAAASPLLSVMAFLRKINAALRIGT